MTRKRVETSLSSALLQDTFLSPSRWPSREQGLGPLSLSVILANPMGPSTSHWHLHPRHTWPQRRGPSEVLLSATGNGFSPPPSVDAGSTLGLGSLEVSGLTQNQAASREKHQERPGSMRGADSSLGSGVGSWELGSDLASADHTHPRWSQATNPPNSCTKGLSI